MFIAIVDYCNKQLLATWPQIVYFETTGARIDRFNDCNNGDSSDLCLRAPRRTARCAMAVVTPLPARFDSSTRAPYQMRGWTDLLVENRNILMYDKAMMTLINYRRYCVGVLVTWFHSGLSIAKSYDKLAGDSCNGPRYKGQQSIHKLVRRNTADDFSENLL